jgi:hypothetical protein
MTHPRRSLICVHFNVALQVKLMPTAAGVSFEPHPLHDSCEFDSLSALVHRLDTQGYYGGIRLLMVSNSKSKGVCCCPVWRYKLSPLAAAPATDPCQSSAVQSYTARSHLHLSTSPP